MALAAVRSKAVALLLFVHCCSSHCLWGLVLSLCFVLQCFMYFMALGKRGQVAVLLLCSECHVAVISLWLFLAMPHTSHCLLGFCVCFVMHYFVSILVLQSS